MFRLPIDSLLSGVGVPLSLGKIYFYESGTSTPLSTFSDNALTVPNTNPVILDSEGRHGAIFLQAAAYKAIVKTAAGVQIGDTIDPVQGAISLSDGTISYIQLGTGAVTRTVLDKLRDGRGVKDFGVLSDGSTDDTTALQVQLNINGGIHLDLVGDVIVTQVRLPSVGRTSAANYKNVIDGRGYFIKRKTSAAAAASLFDLKDMNNTLCHIGFDGIKDTNLECVVHWYSNDTNTYIPQYNDLDDVSINNGVIGLCIGALPSQADPIAAQGVVVANDVATNAPLSESPMRSVKFLRCLNPLYMRQPNGKITAHGCQFVCDTGHWSSPDLTKCVAIYMLSSSELLVQGGEIVNNVSALADGGRLIDLRQNAHLVIQGAIIETSAPSYMANSTVLEVSGLMNAWGLNGGARILRIEKGADRFFRISNCTLAAVAGGALTQPSLFDCVDGSPSGTTDVNLKFVGYFDHVEFRDVPFANAASSYVPLTYNFRSFFTNCWLTSYDADSVLQYRKFLHDGRELLSDASIDQSAFILPASDQTSDGTGGGWTFDVTAAGDIWRGVTTSLPSIPDRSPVAAMLLSAVGSSVTATTTAKFKLTADKKVLIVRCMMKTNATGQGIVRMFWYDQGGSAFTTASIVLWSGNLSTLTANGVWTPMMFMVQPPDGAMQATLQFGAITIGAAMYVENPSVR